MRAVAAANPAEFDALALTDLLREYRSSLRVAGRSPRTIRWYLDGLREFVTFVERDHDLASLADLRPPVVRRWLLAVQAQRERPLAPASLAGRVRTIRAFGSWVAQELDLPDNPVRGVPVPHVPERVIPSLRETDVLELLRAIDAGSSVPERDRAIVLLLLDTGVRLSEAAGIRIGDLDLVEGRCRVMGKGSRERVVPLGRKTRQALRRVIARRGSTLAADAVFVGPDGRPLAPHAIQQLFRRLSRRATLGVRCSPHILRHTFARAFLQNGGDVFSLQRILGHSPRSLQVTRRYVDLLDDDLRAVHRTASPVDRLG